MIPKISIIAPVYQVEQYVARCIDSVLVQTFTDWELLLIDDGSTDQSGQICDAYALKDDRIHVFHTANGGTSSARNRGLDEARGEWIAFIDPDDWWDKRCLEICYHAVTVDNLDIVQHGHYSVEENIMREKYNWQTTIMDADSYVTNNFQNIEVWASLIRKNVIDSISLRFKLGLRNGQDCVFMISLLKYCKRIKHIPNTLYYYYKDNCGSATHNVTSSKLLDLANSYIEIPNWPAIKPFIDIAIINYAFSIYQNHDTSEKVISDLIKRAKISTSLPYPYYICTNLFHINVRFAFYALRLAFIIKNLFQNFTCYSAK